MPKLLSTESVIKSIFIQIFGTCTNLRYLNVDPRLNYYKPLLFNSQCPIFFCSTLQELHVNMDNYDTCLYLLDGRFNELDTFYVNISSIIWSKLNFTNLVGWKKNYLWKRIDKNFRSIFILYCHFFEEKLPNTKYFSLNIDSPLYYSDRSVILLLQRMANLEKLVLYFEVKYVKYLSMAII
jgi:hypothetical protein